MDIIRPTIIGLLTGVVGTGVGGLISLLFDFSGGKKLSFLLAASGGVMISISLVELIPEAIEVGSKAMAAVGLLLGVLALFILDMVLPHTHSSLFGCGKRGVYHGERTAKLRSVGVLIGLGIAMHNLPEGLAIGAAYAHQESLGLSISHDCCSQHSRGNGYGSVPLKAGNLKPKPVVWSTVLAGIPVGIGALAGASRPSFSHGPFCMYGFCCRRNDVCCQ